MVTAFGELGSDDDGVWASKIRAIYDYRGLVFTGVLDLWLVFGYFLFEMGFRKADCSGDVAHFIKEGGADVIDQRCVALNELVEVAQGHASDRAKWFGNLSDFLGRLDFGFGRVEWRDGLFLRIDAG